jgi:hypothetical protein
VLNKSYTQCHAVQLSTATAHTISPSSSQRGRPAVVAVQVLQNPLGVYAVPRRCGDDLPQQVLN